MRGILKNLIVFLLLLSAHIPLFAQFDDLIREAESMPNDTAKVEKLIEISKAFSNSDIDTSMYYAKQAEILAKQLNYHRGIVAVNLLYGTEHFYKGNYPEAKAILQEASLEAESNNYTTLLAGSKLLLGNVYAKMQEYDLAIKSYREGIAICEEAGNYQTASSLYVAIGISKRLQGDLDSALYYYQHVLEIQENQLKDSTTLAGIYNNIGSIHFYQGDYATTEKYILKALEINRAIKNVRFELINLANLGAIMGEAGELDKSMEYFSQAIELAKKRGEKESLFNFYKEMATINYLNEEYKEAYDFLELSNTYKDSVFGENKQAQLLELEKQYETRKIQDSLRLKEQDLGIALASEEAAQEKASKTVWQLVGSIVLTASVLVILFFVYRNSKNQKRINQVLTDKNEEINQQKLIIEEKNTELTDSITYAKRIQTALLPSQDYMNEILGDHFLLFKPKDIVSGDFYWVKSINGRKFFTVADCTGHGVPGAMVSMLGYDTIEKISMLEFKDSADFISKVNNELVTALSSQSTKSAEQVKDGMDISFCSIEGLQLDFCGANNSCYIIRHLDEQFPQETEKIIIHRQNKFGLIEIKPNKRPVGFHHSDDNFTAHQIDLQQGDMIVLFSDGYADQFGGDKGKKMKSSTFREILLSKANENPDEIQSHLVRFLDEWMGEFDQLDDITVLGVRV